MASIGGTDCSIILAPVPGNWHTQVVLFEHPGLDGTGALLLGNRNTPTAITAMKFVNTFSDLTTWHRALRNHVGSLVTIVTEVATTTNCLVVSVGHMETRPFYLPSTYAYQGVCAIQIMAAFYN